MTSNASSTGLRGNCLSFPEVLIQSVGTIAPSLTAAINIGIVFGSSGNGTWMAYAIGTIGLILVAYNINHFATQFGSSPGALYLYIARAFSPFWGIIAGWGLVFSYLIIFADVVAGFSYYANLIFADLGFNIPSILLYIISIIVVTHYSADVQISTVMIFIVQLISIGGILLLALIALVNQGFTVDSSQLLLADTSINGIGFGAAIAIVSFVGFESCISLGKEAKNSTTSIPRSLIWSVVSSGLFFILLAYIEVIGFQAYPKLLETSAPLYAISQLAGMQEVGWFVNSVILFTFIGCAIASLNAGSRIMFSLACNKFFPRKLTYVNPKSQTPYMAMRLLSAIGFLIVTVMQIFGISDLDIFGYLGTMATYGFLFIYVLVSLAAPIYLAQRGKLKLQHKVFSILAVLFISIPITSSFYPVPPYPFSLFPYLFLIYLGVGAFLYIRSRSQAQSVAVSVMSELNRIDG
ncbi:MAG: APC family permease [Cyanobacteria bacterium CRU_2_1]|nr:APC family permease [Cyanobacteria bacterium RU_5_0]NJR59754.1 APC family permease [Cyanobacteria bacterium CRU_2_1]